MSEIRLHVDNLIDFSDAAKMLGVSRQTVHAWVREGKFKLVEIGDRRFLLREELERVIKERKREAK